MPGQIVPTPFSIGSLGRQPTDADFTGTAQEGSVFSDASPAGGLWTRRAGTWTTPSSVPPGTFSVKLLGGVSANGLYDEQSIQRTINAAAGGIASGGVPIGNYGGTILVDVPINIGFVNSGQGTMTAVKFPSKGVWEVRGVIAPHSIASNDGGLGNNTLGVQIPGNIVVFPIGPGGVTGGAQSAPAVPSASFGIFESSTVAGNKLLSVGFRNLSVYQPFINQVFYLINAAPANANNSLGNLWIENCILNQVNGVAFNNANSVPDIINISGCDITGQAFCGNGAAQVVNVFNCFFQETGGISNRFTAGVAGTLIHSETYPVLNFHNNMLLGNPGVGASQNYAAICVRNVSQTEFISINNNVFYGAFNMVLYYKNNNGLPGTFASSPATIGLVFNNNLINGWNGGNFTVAPSGVQAGSAVVIDVSTATNPEQVVNIGPNNWIGGLQSGQLRFNGGTPNRALEIVSSPFAQNISLDRKQLIRTVTNAPIRVNGTDYGPLQRTDTATVTNGSATVSDASILASDLGKVVTGTGIPGTNLVTTFVGTVTAGVSFLLSSTLGTQTNVLATANGTSVTLDAIPPTATILGERRGVATLSGGTVTVAATWVQASTKFQLTRSVAGGTLGHLSYAITPGVSFTITGSGGADTSTINWYADEIGVPF